MTDILQAISLDRLGQACALLAAFTWAFALILFKRSGEQIDPLAMNLFKNTLATVLLIGTILAMGDGFDTIAEFPIEDTYILILSGVIGLAIADMIFLHSLNLIGVSLFAIVDCTYSPIVIFASWLFLSEKLTLYHYVGGGLILVGLLISSKHPPPPGRTRRQLVSGLLLGVLSIALMAIGIVMTKIVLETDGFPLIWGTTIRLIAGAGVLAVWAVGSGNRAKIWSVFRPAAVWKYCVPASFLGSYLAMIFWVGGFKYTHASVAAVLNQMSVIFAMILAWLILKEQMSARKIIAITIAVTGVMLVTLSGS